MRKFKTHILFKFVEGPWGGGNQFLKGLRNYFEQMKVYEEDPARADIILFNSHHSINEVLRIKRRYKNKIFVHRVDGPVFSIRDTDKHIDKIIFSINDLVADGTIFQSKWSKEKCFEFGMENPRYREVIINAPDPSIFYALQKIELKDRKIKIIATSWSSNVKKGFDIYEYLDFKLDFDRYEMTFVGNSPIRFNNISYIGPLTSWQLAEELRKHDIYITASLDDPCSNSLIEALHCGLPAVVRESGGHREIVGDSGIMFDGKEDVCSALDTVAHNYVDFVSRIKPPQLKEIGKRYYAFFQSIVKDICNGTYTPKKLSLIEAESMALRLKFSKYFRLF